MDNGYRFGRIEVTCEGYSHPSDPYILKGSCGLEYTLELTEEGRRRNHGSWSSHKSGGFEGRYDKNAGRVSFPHGDNAGSCGFYRQVWATLPRVSSAASLEKKTITSSRATRGPTRRKMMILETTW